MTPRLPSSMELSASFHLRNSTVGLLRVKDGAFNFQAPVSWASRIDGLLACSLRSLHKAAPLGSCAASPQWVRRRHSPVCCAGKRPDFEAQAFEDAFPRLDPAAHRRAGNALLKTRARHDTQGQAVPVAAILYSIGNCPSTFGRTANRASASGGICARERGQ